MTDTEAVERASTRARVRLLDGINDAWVGLVNAETEQGQLRRLLDPGLEGVADADLERHLAEALLHVRAAHRLVKALPVTDPPT